MRLLEVSDEGRISFTDDLRANIPRYAILSHRWGKETDEVLYADVVNNVALQKPGYNKLQFCIDRVKDDGLRHFWIDTCCIDKSNLPELSESITSMFRWYRDAVTCYVFLSDISSRRRDHNGNLIPYGSILSGSSWFSRGWTLQELLAPSIVEFYSRECDYLGDRKTLAHEIHGITKIPILALNGAPLKEFTAEEKYQWAESRETTRIEDKAYCLQGIFDVCILPNYGEGESAKRRLIQEVNRATSYRFIQTVASAPASRSEVNVPRLRQSAVEINVHMDRWKSLLASLHFSDMDTRLSSIKPAYSSTCHWILETSAWLDWLDSQSLNRHYGFLWVHGKPGAGKSTIMKFAYDQAVSKRLKDEVILCFFFHARGNDLEKSTLGMYRALLYQLLSCETARVVFADIAFPVDFTDRNYSWTVYSLCRVLHCVIIRMVVGSTDIADSGPTSVKLFIDALDECSESEVQEMVHWFEDLGMQCVNRRGQLRVCFASRHYPTIDTGPGLQMNIEFESGHGNDLEIYIRRHLRSKDPQVNIEDLQKSIKYKARGVFLWVVLVVGILSKEIKDGRVHAVQKRLQEIPDKLSDLFQDIIQRDRDNLEEFKFCLQLVLFAKRPLTNEEFYLAMLAGTDSDSQDNVLNVSKDTLLRFVLSTSKGLAELTRSKKTPMVQFIHESVKDFLIKDKGLLKLWPDMGINFEHVGHERVRQCCENYLGLIFTRLSPARPIEPQMSDLIDQYPFFGYATQHILHHAENASVAVNQNCFLDRFSLLSWIKCHNALARHENHGYAPNSDLSYILAAEGCAQLITLKGPYDLWARTSVAKRNFHTDDGSVIRIHTNSFHFPFCVALARQNHKVAVALLAQNGVTDEVATQLSLPPKGRLTKSTEPIAALCYADNAAIVMELLANPSCPERYDLRVIAAAIEGGNHEIVDLLFPTVILRTKYHVAECTALSTLLLYVCGLGQDDRVRRILDERPDRFLDLDVGGSSFYSALAATIDNSRVSTAKILLDSKFTGEYIGYDTSGRGRTMGRILARAVRLGKAGVIPLLLQHGARIDWYDNLGQTALTIAIARGNLEVVELLLQVEEYNPLDPKTQFLSLESLQIQDPLFIAMSNGNLRIIRLLLTWRPISELFDIPASCMLIYMAWHGCKRATRLLCKEAVQVSLQHLIVTKDLFPLWRLYKRNVPPRSLWLPSCIGHGISEDTIFPLQLRPQIEHYEARCEEFEVQSIGSASESETLRRMFESLQIRKDEVNERTALMQMMDRRHDDVLDSLDTALEPFTCAVSP